MFYKYTSKYIAILFLALFSHAKFSRVKMHLTAKMLTPKSPFFITFLFLSGNITFFLEGKKHRVIVDVCFLAKSTELLPSSQEGSKRIQSVPSSANAAHPSSETAGFEEGEVDNLGRFPLVSSCLP